MGKLVSTELSSQVGGITRSWRRGLEGNHQIVSNVDCIKCLRCLDNDSMAIRLRQLFLKWISGGLSTLMVMLTTVSAPY